MNAKNKESLLEVSLILQRRMLPLSVFKLFASQNDGQF